MPIEELFEFVYILIDKKKVTASEMAKHFGVSSRTIYRWIEALCLSGIPVYSLKGRGGGIAISENYTLDKTILSEEEKIAIVSSVKALNSLSGNSSSLVNANIKAAEKLSHLTAASSRESDWLEVDFSPWSPERQNVKQLFGILRDCILKKRQVTFDYFSGDGSFQRRTVHPWKLIYKGQAWYLQGWCILRKAERFFKLSRMRNVKMTGRAVTIPKESKDFQNEIQSKDLGRQAQKDRHPQSKTHKTENQVQIPLVTIKAKIKPAKIPYLFDAFVCSKISPHKDGSISATFTAPEAPYLIGILLSFDSDIKILSPKKLAQEVQKKAEEILTLYS